MYDPDEECKEMIVTIKRLCEQKNMTPHALAKEVFDNGVVSTEISELGVQYITCEEKICLIVTEDYRIRREDY